MPQRKSKQRSERPEENNEIYETIKKCYHPFPKNAVYPDRFLDDSCKRLEAEEDINFMWNNEIVKLYEKLIGYGFNFSDCFNEEAVYALTTCHLNSN